ncbi:MAG: S9 family peptidase [Tannerellaceae bacterium]|jgi:dipeptidyl aminopeptidase/acylaminoacyl peptidase|nr:S9 family peptidase [Tannerellaceae bacterium]
MSKKILSPLHLVICLYLFVQANHLFAQTLPGYAQARRFTPANAEQLLFSYTLTPHYFHRSAKFWYEYKTSEGTQWYVVDPETQKKQPLFDRDELAAQITETVKDPYTAQQLPLTNLKLEDDDQTFTFEITSSAGRFYFSYNYITRRLSPSTATPSVGTSWGNVSPDKQWVVFAGDLNLYCISYADYEKLQKNPQAQVAETPLTTDGVEHFAFGMPHNRLSTDTLYDHKRKRVRGLWSPDGRYFVSTLQDERSLQDIWVIHSTAQPRPVLESYRYQMPGEPGAPNVRLYLFDLAQKSRKEIRTEAYKNQLLSLAAKPVEQLSEPAVWLGNDTRFFLTRISRDMKRVDICTYTLGEDSIKSIIPERMNTYIETRPLALTEQGDELIHWSERDGWAHLYLYNTEGKLKNRITQGPWHVDKIQHIDSKARVVYFIANGRETEDTTPYYEHLYRINFDGTGLKLLTPGDYFHLTYMDKEGRFVVDNYSRINTIPATALYNNRGTLLMKLEESDFSQLLLTGYRFPEPFRVKAADGVTDLYGIMYKPVDFDSTRLYPIIDYVYPGPQMEGTYFRYIPMNPRTDRLAQAGFVVISVGHRGGHPSRSKWYHNHGYGDLRDYPLADHKAAIEQLCDRYDFLDIHRIGIHGHSGGGFMSTAAMLVYPDFYKVAVSCAGNHDNHLNNRNWSEKHHGVKELTDETGETRFEIKVAANQEIAGNLKGHLLLIHADEDNNVNPAQTYTMANELIKAGKRFDMLIIPGQQHHFENYNEYFYWRMVDYFSHHLLGRQETDVDIRDIKLGNWFQGYQE